MSDNLNIDTAITDEEVTTNNGETDTFDDLFCGLDPDYIISGFKDVRIGEPVFIFKWKNSPNLSRIAASIANVKYPQHVINFYEGFILSSVPDLVVVPKFEDKENHDSSNLK